MLNLAECQNNANDDAAISQVDQCLRGYTRRKRHLIVSASILPFLALLLLCWVGTVDCSKVEEGTTSVYDDDDEYVPSPSVVRMATAAAGRIAPLPPSFVNDGVLWICRDDAINHLQCLETNANTCDAMCNSTTTTTEFLDLTSCDAVTTTCARLTCCSVCDRTGKTLGTCMTDTLGCNSDCGTLAPTGPTTPSPFIAPVFTSTPVAAVSPPPSSSSASSLPMTTTTPSVTSTTAEPMTDAPMTPPPGIAPTSIPPETTTTTSAPVTRIPSSTTTSPVLGSVTPEETDLPTTTSPPPSSSPPSSSSSSASYSRSTLLSFLLLSLGHQIIFCCYY